MSRETWKALAAVTACGLAMSACASLKPKPAPVAAVEAPPPAAPEAPPPATVIVKVPVPAPAPVKAACVPKAFPRAPKYPDTDAALRDAGGAADRYQLMAAGRLLRERRLAELEKVVDGCR
jgi:hypothetical protein